MSPSIRETTSCSASCNSHGSRDKISASYSKPSVDLYVATGSVILDDAVDFASDQQDWHERSASDFTRMINIDVINAVHALCSASLIRVQARSPGQVLRIFALPEDVARNTVNRAVSSLRKHWTRLLAVLEISRCTWQGILPENPVHFETWSTPNRQSLFYMFNHLPSPRPEPRKIPNRFTRKSIDRLLDQQRLPRGLLTNPYPYQRRSAAVMLQRESAPELVLDPRLEPRVGPTGQAYFYGPRSQSVLRDSSFYETVRGGILAETMGLGKTLICLCAILTTRGQYPQVPPHYVPLQVTTSSSVGSLADLAAHQLVRYSIPWRQGFEDLAESSGYSFDFCVDLLGRQPAHYFVPPRIIRSNRSSHTPGPFRKVLLSSGTVIVVPRNLLHQWQSELDRHVEKGILEVLVLDKLKDAIPAPEDLVRYDLVLFSRSRFENEVKDTEELYESPLKSVHFLRLIVDEGHGFSSSNTNAAVAAERLICAERRWIVSGTPAKDLMGVEVDTESLSDTNQSSVYRDRTLSLRRDFDWVQERSSGAVKSLGLLLSRFLKVQPWTPSEDSPGAAANWDDHVFRHEDFKGRTYSSFSSCFQRTLESVVVRTRPEDVEKDLVLPPLTHTVVRLEPSFCDKMTANLFVLLFTANAITSERSDQDYLFHKASTGHLTRLIINLRQSTFYWSGFTPQMVRSSMEIAQKYLDRIDVQCANDDRALMLSCMASARHALESPIWAMLTDTQEVGVIGSNWPVPLQEPWSLLEGCIPMFMSLSMCLTAQRRVNSFLNTENPLNGMDVLGWKLKLEASEEARQLATNKQRDDTTMVKTGIPDSTVKVDTMGLKRLSVSGTLKASPRKSRKRSSSKSVSQESQYSASIGSSPGGERTDRTRLELPDSRVELDPGSDLGRTSLVGSTSAKLSYLVDRVVDLHDTEKILIFYEGNHVAYYISQMLDLLHIKHLIYANTLSGELRSKYVVLFNSDQTHRVLIMDIKQAAHGLNISSASRVFFVSPTCRPDTEAQAIKRAHRIGQSRPVHVETLVLRGTVEEKMYERSLKMSKGEHLAARLLEDDEGIRGIIQNARVLPILDSDLTSPYTRFQTPQQIFGRPGRNPVQIKTTLETELFGETDDGIRLGSLDIADSIAAQALPTLPSAPSIFGGSG